MASRDTTSTFSMSPLARFLPRRVLGLPGVVRYGAAAAAAAAGVLLRFALGPFWGSEPRFVTFYAGVMVSAWIGGFGPGMMATLLCAAAVDYFWMPPLFSLRLSDSGDAAALALFVVVGTLVSGLNELWRQAAVATGRAEEKLRVTLSSIGDGVITTDHEGRVSELNAVAQGLTGWTQAEAAGQSLEDVFAIVDEKSRHPAESLALRVLREGTVVGLANHTILLSRDGREIPVDDSASPIRAADGSMTGVVIVFRDVTDRRRAEREREALLQTELTARADAERVADELSQLAAFTDTALDHLDRVSLIPELLARLRATLGGDTATILLLDQDGQYLRPVASDGLEEEIGADVRIPVGRGVTGRIAEGDRALVFSDLSDVEVVSPLLRERVTSLVGAPLRVDDRLIGVLHVGVTTSRQFTDADARLVSRISERLAVALDRAQLLKAERATRAEADAANQRLRFALKAGRMGTWQWTIRTGKVVWSDGLEAIHGYAPGTFPGTMEAVQQEIHPADRDRVLGAIAEAVAERRDYEVTYRIVRRDGAVRWVEGRGQIFTDADGQPDRMTGVCSDISERKQAEEALRESEERFRLMADAAPVLIWLSGLDKRCTWFNTSWLEFVGRSMEQEIGDGWAENVHPDDLARCLQTYTAAFDARQAFSMEYRLKRHDGEYRWLLDNGVPRYGVGGEFSGYIGSCIDITERRYAEERFRLAIEAAPSGMIMVDRRGIIQHVNLLAEQLLGYTRDEIVGQPIERLVPARFRGGHAEYRTLFFMNPSQRPMGSGRDLYALRKDGSEVPVEIGLSPIETVDGPIVLAAITDITERKRGAMLLEGAFDAERAAKREAQRANQLKDHFLAMVSHELRAPLSAVVGWAEVLRTGVLDDARRQRALDAVFVNAKRQAQLIDDLLDATSIMSGRMRVQRTAVDLPNIVRSALDVIHPSADAKRIHVETAIAESIGTVFGDAARLQQIFWNLLANGVKFTPEGGAIHVSVRRTDSVVEIAVTDSGQGIGSDFLPRVFEPFQQADISTTRTHGGLGLGLAIVKHLVEAHGGTVSAHSAGEGHGSTFTVRLPIVAVCADEPDASPSWPGSAGHVGGPVRSLEGITVLVVDDDADSRDLLTACLEASGASVLTAGSAAEAITVLQRERVDVLLADIVMPGEDGYALIRQVRVLESPLAATVPAAALSSLTHEDDKQRALHAGFQMHLGKPIESSALVEAVASLMMPIAGHELHG